MCLIKFLFLLKVTKTGFEPVITGDEPAVFPVTLFRNNLFTFLVETITQSLTRNKFLTLL